MTGRAGDERPRTLRPPREFCLCNWRETEKLEIEIESEDRVENSSRREFRDSQILEGYDETMHDIAKEKAFRCSVYCSRK